MIFATATTTILLSLSIKLHGTIKILSTKRAGSGWMIAWRPMRAFPHDDCRRSTWAHESYFNSQDYDGRRWGRERRMKAGRKAGGQEKVGTMDAARTPFPFPSKGAGKCLFATVASNMHIAGAHYHHHLFRAREKGYRYHSGRTLERKSDQIEAHTEAREVRRLGRIDIDFICRRYPGWAHIWAGRSPTVSLSLSLLSRSRAAE